MLFNFDKKGQGAIEYLLIVGGAILIAAIVLAVMINTSDSTTDQLDDQTDRFSDIVDRQMDDIERDLYGGCIKDSDCPSFCEDSIFYSAGECDLTDNNCKYDLISCEYGCDAEGCLNECTEDSDCQDNATCNGGTCECDEGYGGNDCTLLCGNGTTNDGEQCDDGNPDNGDGCSSACEVEEGYSCRDTPVPGRYCFLDADSDNISDETDNCPNTPNEDQADADNDGVGDACDLCEETPELPDNLISRSGCHHINSFKSTMVFDKRSGIKVYTLDLNSSNNNDEELIFSTQSNELKQVTLNSEIYDYVFGSDLTDDVLTIEVTGYEQESSPSGEIDFENTIIYIYEVPTDALSIMGKSVVKVD